MGETFGGYVRSHRVAAGISLRAAAKEICCSHVFLSEVERGRRRMGERWWQLLAWAIPTISLAELVRLAAPSADECARLRATIARIREICAVEYDAASDLRADILAELGDKS